MTIPEWLGKAKDRRAFVLAGLILGQGVCALFFVGDVVEDFEISGVLSNPYLVLEAIAAAMLILGVVFLMLELRRLLARMADMEAGLDVARGHLSDVIASYFDDWNLTNAERDVAIMILKGLDNDAIARVRNTASGTVRAQSTSVYAKSGTDGRAQFISLFMEELMAGDISQNEAAARPPAA